MKILPKSIRNFFCKSDEKAQQRQTTEQKTSKVSHENIKNHTFTTQSNHTFKASKQEGSSRWSITNKIIAIVRDFFYGFFNGKESKQKANVSQGMAGIGGVSLNIKRTDGSPVNGMHFKADDMLKKMQNAKVERQSISLQKSGETVEAMIFDKGNPEAKKLLDSMHKSGFFEFRYEDKDGHIHSNSKGVLRKTEIDGKVYVFNNDDWDKFIAAKPLRRGKFNTSKVSLSAKAPFSASNTPRKTVILSGGIYSRVHSGRTTIEVAHFLMLGFDVVAIEDKLSNKSAEGEILSPKVKAESYQSVMDARRSVAEYLRNSGIKKNDMVWKGTCFSTASAVQSAKQFGGHVLIQDPYYNITSLVYGMVREQLNKKYMAFAAPFVSPIIRQVAERDAMDFRYDLKDVADVPGEVMIIRNQNDKIIDSSQQAKIEQKLKSKGKHYKTFKVTDKNVRHAGHFGNDTQCSKDVKNYLVQKGFCSGNLFAA